jgi:gamma-glutamyltranspeptidase/glutathione hydrolase
MMRITLLLIVFLTFSNCKNEPKASTTITSKRGVIAKNAMVVSARKEASKIGIKILKQGGNAFDAMMATEMALAVCYPYAGNLGGGGF